MSSIIRLSDNAALRIKEIMSNAEKNALGVRVSVKSGGCAGMSYVMEYSQEIKLNELNEDQKIQIMSLSGVKQYPMRVKCATLAWHTLTSAITNKKKEVNTETID